MDEAELSDDAIPSKLRPLLAAFRDSPFRVAPERLKEMAELQDRFDIRIVLKPNAKDWLFEEFRMFELKRVVVGLRSIERLWAYCYAYTAIATELQKAVHSHDVVENTTEVALAFKLLNWASQKNLADREGQWPDALPDPSQEDGLEHVRAANHFFLMTSGRLLLHEFAHTVLGHSTATDTSSNLLRQEEFEADEWADRWMLGRWQDYNINQRVFVGRCLGIAFAHAPTLIFGVDRREPSQSHPGPIERIVSFVDRYMPNGNPTDKRDVDLPCAFLLIIVMHLLHTNRAVVTFDPLPSTYSELFTRFAPYFR